MLQDGVNEGQHKCGPLGGGASEELNKELRRPTPHIQVRVSSHALQVPLHHILHQLTLGGGGGGGGGRWKENIIPDLKIVV